VKFRLKLFGAHLLSSASVLALVWAALYLGWYRWPGWYLSGVLSVAAVMAGVDVVLGPSLTLIIANPNKTRRELTRDIAIIVAVQLTALVYGAATLWHGRPLYYTYSVRFLQMVQAGDLSPEQIAMGQQVNPQLAPHWYSLPRWIYAPLPSDAKSAEQIVGAAVTGGDDVIELPRFYKPWEEGLSDIRANLWTLDKLPELTAKERVGVAQRMRELAMSSNQPTLLPMLGRGRPLVAVVDPKTAQIKTLIRVD
jgi:hypothetical protein